MILSDFLSVGFVCLFAKDVFIYCRHHRLWLTTLTMTVMLRLAIIVNGQDFTNSLESVLDHLHQDVKVIEMRKQRRTRSFVSEFPHMQNDDKKAEI